MNGPSAIERVEIGDRAAYSSEPWTPLEALRYHVSGAIARGEAEAIEEVCEPELVKPESVSAFDPRMSSGVIDKIGRGEQSS